MGRESSIGIANRYELDGLRIEARWRFSAPFRPDFRPNHSPLQSVPDLSGGRARSEPGGTR